MYKSSLEYVWTILIYKANLLVNQYCLKNCGYFFTILMGIVIMVQFEWPSDQNRIFKKNQDHKYILLKHRFLDIP